MSSLNLNAFVGPAADLAREAGQKIMSMYGNVKAELHSDGSILTEADKAADEIIVRGLERYFPRHIIISEERPLNGRQSPFKWVVDPLDGTADYLEHTGQFSVQVGLVWGTQPIVGVVYLPAEDALYRATTLDGAFIERAGIITELHVSGRTRHEARLVLSRKDFGDPTLVEKIKTDLGVAEVMQAGSFGYKVGLIAEGKADAYINTKKAAGIWDAFPPEIILQGAGGRVTDFDGRQLHYITAEGPRLLRGAICSNGVFHDDLARLANEHLKVD